MAIQPKKRGVMRRKLTTYALAVTAALLLLIPQAQSLTLGVDESGWFTVPSGADQVDGALAAQAVQTNRDHDVHGTAGTAIAVGLYGSQIQSTGWYYDNDSSPASPGSRYFCQCWDEGAQQFLWTNISFTVVSPF